ncbi:hypothetical protein GHT06_013294 [Daphnia sinensis]|uniref:Uncharacterized protein n=1 Tax=Daphnia sinensis TaxID=1820382 RepID=A0AAD5KZ80_9CRUS|nr:hypothetical protein GHT06_013294 [Daphnia sinensis]
MPFMFIFYSLTVFFCLFVLEIITVDTTNFNQRQQQTGRKCSRYSRICLTSR